VRIRCRVLTVGAIAGLAVAGLAGPAFAHVEVSADKTRAGDTNVTLTFSGEAENPAAGIKTERVVLPEGIAPADVTLVKVPSGWTFTSTADGFTVGGKALKIGTDAKWSVRIAKLPAGATRLNFKTLETYGNGEISRWIELQEPGQAEPDNPAPQLVLKPAAATTPSAVSSPSVAPATAATSPQADSTADSSGTSTWWIWVVVVLVLVAGGIIFLVRRSRSTRGIE
jgi:Domain of unkown function (DUF1775)